MSVVSRFQVLSLYRRMLRESQKFTGYNYREYALRRIRDAFKDSKSVNDTEVVISLLTKADKSLQLLQRQTLMGRMYSQPKLVLEKQLTDSYH
ncbi:LYR motif-containing protein 4-like [Corticium candelabrum]|uniref:LYR motif-containing protein 4-like n=1 Tax=Corticium candelabrum TaxID=121492 RepID=UPI002E2738EE|nr:LYR motif-containing protein 4-like [Corticium candelabrum]